MTTPAAVVSEPVRTSYGSRVASRFRAYALGGNARIVGIDIARGLAVLGMFGAHIGVTETFDWAKPATWLDLVHGRSSILFATLAGVSIAIISGRTSTLDGLPLLQARVRILVRAALIFAFGGLLEFLGTGVAVILPMYAALFVVSLPFLRWRSRRLFIAAGITALVTPLLLHVKPYAVFPDAPLGSSGFTDLMFYGTYPGITWMAFVFVGLGIGRLDLSRLGVQVRILIVGGVLAAIAYSIGGLGGAALNGGDGSGGSSSSSWSSIPSSGGELSDPIPGSEVDISESLCDDYGDGTVFCYPEGYYEKSGPTEPEVPSGPDYEQLFDLRSLLSIEPHSGTPFEVVGSGGFALAVIALALLASRRRVIRTILYPIACVGAMALTAYSVHIVAIFALAGAAFAGVDNWLYLAFVVVALVGCTAWTTFVGRGPLERFITVVSHRTAELASKPSTHPSSPTEPTHD